VKKDWHELISQPKYGMKLENDIFVPVRDGIKLAVDVFRPDARGKFPALLGLSPYGKELQELMMPPQALGESAVWDGNIEAGNIPYFVSRGYALIVADLRGSGNSEGEFHGHFNPDEGRDGHDLVEWLAQQPWCNGNVGMVGRSYYAQTQMETAIEQPPHLKAICPVSEFSDFYRHQAYPGGVLSLFLYGLWDGRGGTSGCAHKNAVSVMMKELPKKEFERRRQEILSNPDIINYPNLFHLMHYPEKNPPYFDILMNPYDGPYHRERSTYPRFNKINIPTYIGGSWGNINAKSFWLSYNGLKTKKKIMVTGKSMADRPWREDNDIVLRWYDHWLKGIDTGIMDEPPIKFYVYGAEEWQYAEQWPLPGIEWTQFFLHGWERLSTVPELYNDEPDCFLQHPLHLSNKRDNVKYFSASMSEDLTVIGPAALYLYAAIDQTDTNWIVKVAMVKPDGSEQRLGTSYLKASHRAIDAKKSEPYYPWHPHTSSEPVIPGEIYEYAMELDPIACVFKAGSRIKLEIGSMESTRDPEFIVHYHPHLCSSKTTLHKIFRDKAHQSHMLLPVIPVNKR
jgi:uncharacterized protein